MAIRDRIESARIDDAAHGFLDPRCWFLENREALIRPSAFRSTEVPRWSAA
jgi:hypothetical protein